MRCVLDGDDGGLDALDEAEHGGGHPEAVLQRGVDLEAGEVEVEGRGLVAHHGEVAGVC